MQFQLASDLHLDSSGFKFKTPKSKTILLLAGDIAAVHIPPQREILREFLNCVCQQFEKVVYISGNHEHYHGCMLLTPSIIKQIVRELKIKNFVYLENKTLILDDKVAIIGSTFWTNFHESPNPLLIPHYINDYRNIFLNSPDFDPDEKELCMKTELECLNRLITLDDIKNIHNDSVNFVFNEIDRCKKLGLKTIAMTHHAPSTNSISPDFIGNPINGAFVSNYNDFIEKQGPNIWIHGHVHSYWDYMLGNTRVLCNPRGYRSEHGTKFNERLYFSV